MDIKTKKTALKFLSAVSKDNSPRLFLPFILAAVPCIIIDVLTLGVGLIFTSFIWLMLDIETYRFLRAGTTKFVCFYNNGVSFKTLFFAALLRRLILIVGYICLVIPGFYLSTRLSGLSTTILANPTEANALKLLQLTYQDSKHQRLNLITLRLNTFYIIVLTIITFGIISPWSIPYFGMLRHSHYIHDKKLEYASNLIEVGLEEIPPPEAAASADNTMQTTIEEKNISEHYASLTDIELTNNTLANLDDNLT